MATFASVPVIDVHNDNFKQLWPTMILALKSATFVALDLEMSGLGNRRLLLAKSIEDRYNSLCEVAKTRSVVSLGICCFKLQANPNQGPGQEDPSQGQGHEDPSEGQGHEDPSQDAQTSLHFFVQTFDIILLCNESYMVEPESLRFLVQHGFDFNKQYSKGISYHRGLDKPEDAKQSIRLLLNEIIINKVPIALHNGLVDLVFLYQAFYSTIPAKLPQFVANLSEIFVGGIYDTKYIAEYEVRMPSSYLEYVFRKSQRDNVEMYQTDMPHINVAFPRYPDDCDNIEYRECGLPEENRSYDGLQTCNQFGAFGWCKLADNCPNSHDIDAILNTDDHASSRKRRKRKQRPKNKRPKVDCLDTELTDTEKGGEDEISGDEEEVMETVLNTQDPPADDSSTAMQHPGPNGVNKGQNAHDEHENSGKNEVSKNSQTSSVTSPSEGKNMDSNVNGMSIDLAEKKSDKIAQSRCTGHRAGFDAFMTGFTLASAVIKCGKCTTATNVTGAKLSDFKLEKLNNNVYLSGKDMPLKITKSNFSKSSKEHRIKYSKLMGTDT